MVQLMQVVRQKMRLIVFLLRMYLTLYLFFFFQAEDGIRDVAVTGVQTCALPISCSGHVDHAAIGIEGHTVPRICATSRFPSVLWPGFIAWFARVRNRMKAPD